MAMLFGTDDFFDHIVNNMKLHSRNLIKGEQNKIRPYFSYDEEMEIVTSVTGLIEKCQVRKLDLSVKQKIGDSKEDQKLINKINEADLKLSDLRRRIKETTSEEQKKLLNDEYREIYDDTYSKINEDTFREYVEKYGVFKDEARTSMKQSEKARIKMKYIQMIEKRYPQVYHDIWLALYADVPQRILFCLMGYNFYPDQDDINEIFDAVIKNVFANLVKFINESQGHSESERNAYLRRIVECRCKDFFKKHINDKDITIISLEGMNNGNRGVADNDVDAAYSGKQADAAYSEDKGNPSESGVDPFNTKKPEIFLGIVRDVFAFNSKPEFIIGYVLQKIIISEKSEVSDADSSGGEDIRKGAVMTVCDMINGLTLAEARANLFEELYDKFGNAIDNDLFRDLDIKLVEKDEDGNLVAAREIAIVPKTLSNNIYKFGKKLEEKYIK